MRLQLGRAGHVWRGNLSVSMQVAFEALGADETRSAGRGRASFSSPISKFRGQGEKEEPSRETEQEQAGREESGGGWCLRVQGQESPILWSCLSLCPGVLVGGGQKWVGEGRRGGVRQRKHLGKEKR